MTQPKRNSSHLRVLRLLMKPMIILIILFIFYSCDKDEVYPRGGMTGFGQIEISEFNIPDVVNTTEHLQIAVKARASNGCFYDLSFDFDTINNFEYSIRAFAHYNDISGICPTVLVIKDTIINFQPTQTGMYVFNVHITQDSVNIDSLTVI